MNTTTEKKQNRRLQQKLNTRQKILKSAGNLFSTKGIMTTSTAEIAKRAGVAHGTLFVHFPTREDLITDVLTFSLGSLAKQLHEETNGINEIEPLLSCFLDGLQKYEKLYRRILIEQHQLPSLARSTLLGIYSAFSDRLYRAYTISEKDPSKLDQDRLFITWISLINFYITNSDIYSESDSLLSEKNSEIIQHFLQLI